MKHFTLEKYEDNVHIINNKLKLQIQPESPLTLDLKFKIPQHQAIDHLKTKVIDDRTKDAQQDSTDQLLTERTFNEFAVQNKEVSNKSSNIKSYLRIKPYKDCNYIPLDIYNNQTIIIDRSIYKFDHIFQPETPQHKIYEIVGKEVTNNFIEGYNGTIFAYGSTGSGKTYTMFGNDNGIVPSVVQEIFSKLDLNSYKLSCSMIQIYKQNLIDLLCETEVQLKIKQINNSLSIQNLSIHQIKNKEQTYSIIKKGNILKKIRETILNESSSRSHVVFTFYLQKNQQNNRAIRCKFNLVDLAGSEKVCKSKVEGQGLQQAIKINLSLSCLGNTINALVKNSQHIPYRQSKLTRILKESLMGNSITRLIVTCCLTEQSMEETISSIKFAQRAQKIKTQAEVSYHIEKLKHGKEQNHKHIISQLKHAENTIHSIKELVTVPNNCSQCLQIKQILQQTQISTSSQQPSISHLQSVKSPQSRNNHHNYFSNHSISKYSSVNRKDQSKNYSIKINPLKDLKDEQVGQNKQTINKKVYDLLRQTTKLKEGKALLQIRIRQLQDRLNQKELLKGQKVRILQMRIKQLQEKLNQKQMKSDKVRKVIKLNTVQKSNNNRVINVNVKDINMNNANIERMSKGNKQAKENNNKENNSHIINIDKGMDHQSISNVQSPVSMAKIQSVARHQENNQEKIIENLQNNVPLVLITQIIDKLYLATKEYRYSTFPFELQILNNQISILQQAIVQNKIVQSNIMDISKAFRLVVELQKKLCYYVDEIPITLEKLFQINVNSQIKDELFLNLKSVTKEISDIKWNIKELYDESEELHELTTLLQRSKNISFIKEKEKESEHNQSFCSQNQFLMLSYHHLPLSIKPIETHHE